MSNWGLEVRNESGFSNLNPDSFTVKLVESVWVGWESMLWDTVVDIPTSDKVLSTMFAVITDYSGQVAYNASLQETFAATRDGGSGTPLCLPVVEIYNGLVRVKGQPMQYTRATGMIVISIMQHL